MVLRPSMPASRCAEVLAELQRAKTVAIVPVAPLGAPAPSADSLQLPVFDGGAEMDQSESFQVRRSACLLLAQALMSEALSYM